MITGALFNALNEDIPTLMALLILHYAMAGIWIWLPMHGDEKPGTPTILWFLVNLAFTSLLWGGWHQLQWTTEWFAGPVIVVAAVNLALVKPLRARMAGRQADLGLLVLAAGHLALAVPVALAWRWVGPLWALFALGLAWAAGYAKGKAEWEPEEARALLILAIGMASMATLRWMVHAADASWSDLHAPFLNASFVEGVLAASAWGLLIRYGGAVAVVGFIGLEMVGIMTLALEGYRTVRHLDGSFRAASIVVTLIWAILGALQWLRSLTEEREKLALGLMVAGYVWLGLASLKLIFVDMATVDTALRALVFLAVGGILLGAALVANRVRIRRKEAE
jgi:hypothetical protein